MKPSRKTKRVVAWLSMFVSWLALFSVAAYAGTEHADVMNAFDVETPVQPMSVRTNGMVQISYEVHLTSFSNAELEIADVSLVDAKDGRDLTSLSGDALAAVAHVVGETAAPKDGAVHVGPGQRVVLFIDMTVPAALQVDSIRHRISYRAPGSLATHSFLSEAVAVSTSKPSLIGPPLSGGPWVAIHSPLWARGHRRVFVAVEGHAKIPGRFAIDWVKVDERGRTTKGDPDLASQTYGYGDAVLAVDDAVVVATRDGMDEPAHISQRTTHPLADDAGNYLALRLPDGRFAFYEHLKKGSITVKTGDKVKKGQAMASLGFSGESTGPHLHFHIADSDSPLNAEGLPFEIQSFRQVGKYDDVSRLGNPWVPPEPGGTTTRHDEWPGANVVVLFGSATR
jgi:murein DD-endopeptidase